MQDANKTKEHLIQELAAARKQVAELEASEAEHRPVEFEMGATLKALRESERRFRAIFEQSPLGIAVTDSITGHYLEANLKHCEIVGLTHEEMLKVDFQTITHPDDLQEDLDDMRRLVAGEIRGFSMEKRYIRPDGSIVWVNLTVVPMWEEGEPHARHLAMVEDITERKRAESQREVALEALGESERRFRSIVENTEAGYFFIDKNGIIRDVNPAWVRLYRYASAEEILGRHFTVIQQVDDVEKAIETVEGIIRGDSRYLTGEFSRKCKDGAVGYHTFSARPVSRRGEVVGIEGYPGVAFLQKPFSPMELARKVRAVLDAQS
jgi:PAS domain S-box-containing protein